jgi:hypothetical protein
MNSEIIQSLWIGPRLSNMEHLCIKSFIDFGHEFHLYTYDKVDNIPEGVIIKDGNEILPKSEIYRYKSGSVSAFSNLFRFTMLYKKGGYWVDTDLVCVKRFDFKEDYVFTSEPSEDYERQVINAGIIKCPKGSQAAFQGIVIQRRHKQKILSGEITWSSGPKTVQEVIFRNKLEKYVLPWKGICSCSWADTNSLIDRNKKYNKEVILRLQDIPEEMYGIHLWNEVWRCNNFDKDKKYNRCLYEELKEKHKV